MSSLGLNNAVNLLLVLFFIVNDVHISHAFKFILIDEIDDKDNVTKVGKDTMAEIIMFFTIVLFTVLQSTIYGSNKVIVLCKMSLIYFEKFVNNGKNDYNNQ